MQNQIRVGVIGCGKISGAYFAGCRQFDIIDLMACADIDPEVAHAAADEFHIPQIYTVEELLADPSIQIVINLTIPQAHAEINLAALAAGKHVYCEKPLAVTREDGQRTLKKAQEKNLLVGCAPDTFLGGGIQTCRKLIDEGAIGEVVAATAVFANHGHESWHPNPAFYYQIGGGPLFDMGPYYLTALINLIGPIKRVTGATRISFPQRTITSQPRRGEQITVEVPTHITGLMDFANGAVGTIMTSFDIWSHHLPAIEIHGTTGSLSVPDPNTFGGVVRLWQHETQEWQDIPLTHRDDVGRGIGVADMAYALLHNRPHRASGDLAMHVLDTMHAFEEASMTGQHITLTSGCDQPAALPSDLAPGVLD
ncbi:MAG: Gfo/Idh/MocA family oxidoreductase [Chloroflexota bacterium]